MSPAIKSAVRAANQRLRKSRYSLTVRTTRDDDCPFVIFVDDGMGDHLEEAGCADENGVLETIPAFVAYYLELEAEYTPPPPTPAEVRAVAETLAADLRQLLPEFSGGR